ncbi:MAG: hypothetical protein CVT95_09965 [Bacteroidetes bacterium HGW-Bacteroidetes-12]|nr:MAG: hypothetical protein CVT95_09965 [Bacteroidetes bacterium HGW-Bacteroidetes-12]
MKTITPAMYIIVILLLISALFSFNNKKQEENIIPCEEITLRCMLPGKIGIEHIIRNNTDYQKLIQHKNPYSDCGNYQLPVIDFNNYTLIGYVGGVAGCDFPKVTHKVTKINNNYVVNVEIQQIGLCERNNSITIWCLIPKVEENASVKFNITTTIIP